MDGGWQGLELVRVRKPDVNGIADKRGTFYTDGQELNITNVGTFTDGYAVTKYINVNADGSAAQRNDIPDIDFPMFRLTDVYLMYAEATLRGATSNTATALGYKIKELEQMHKLLLLQD
jgi:hypothetical protein